MQIWMKGFDGSITSCQEVGNAAQPSKARPGAVNAQVLEGPSQGRTGDNQDWRAPYHQRTGASSVISGMLDRSRGLVGRHSKAGRSGWEPHVCNYRCGGLIRDPSRSMVRGFGRTQKARTIEPSNARTSERFQALGRRPLHAPPSTQPGPDAGRGKQCTGHLPLRQCPSAPPGEFHFRVFDPLNFLAEVSAHIPDPHEKTTLFYGWYSNPACAVHADRRPPRPRSCLPAGRQVLV